MERMTERLMAKIGNNQTKANQNIDQKRKC
jgi:hypothetical protein